MESELITPSHFFYAKIYSYLRDIIWAFKMVMETLLLNSIRFAYKLNGYQNSPIFDLKVKEINSFSSYSNPIKFYKIWGATSDCLHHCSYHENPD